MLRVRLSIVFPRLGQLSPAERAAYNALRADTRRSLRTLLNDLRRDVRAAAPIRSRRLQRSFRVRATRQIEAGAISMELVSPLFYARLSNDRGSSRGWFDRELADVENDLGAVGRQAAAALGPVILAATRRRALDDLQRAAGRAGFAVGSAGARAVISLSTR